MKKPLIGITLDSENNDYYSKFPWYAMRENYLSSIYKFNAIPFPIMHEKSFIKDICKIIDGLIITGGDFNINPKLYKHNNKGSKNFKIKRRVRKLISSNLVREHTRNYFLDIAIPCCAFNYKI